MYVKEKIKKFACLISIITNIGNAQSACLISIITNKQRAGHQTSIHEMT